MSSGANIGDGGPTASATRPTDLGVVGAAPARLARRSRATRARSTTSSYAGRDVEHVACPTTSPATTNGVQALFTVLPDNEVAARPRRPASGRARCSGPTRATTSRHTMTKTGVSRHRPDREGQLRDRGGVGLRLSSRPRPTAARRGRPSTPTCPTTTVTPVTTRAASTPSGAGITGSTDGAWVDLTATLPAGTNAVRFRYRTDGAVVECGVLVDDIAIDGAVDRHRRDRDRGLDASTASRAPRAPRSRQFFNAYIVENRQYDGYDTSLRTAYNFGYARHDPPGLGGDTTRYQNGAADLRTGTTSSRRATTTSATTRARACSCRSTPTRTFTHWPDGTLMRPRILSYDSTFGLRDDRQEVHAAQRWRAPAGTVPSQAAVPVVRRHAARGGSTPTSTARPAPTRAATSRAGTASTCPRPAPPSGCARLASATAPSTRRDAADWRTQHAPEGRVRAGEPSAPGRRRMTPPADALASDGHDCVPGAREAAYGLGRGPRATRSRGCARSGRARPRRRRPVPARRPRRAARPRPSSRCRATRAARTTARARRPAPGTATRGRCSRTAATRTSRCWQQSGTVRGQHLVGAVHQLGQRQLLEDGRSEVEAHPRLEQPVHHRRRGAQPAQAQPAPVALAGAADRDGGLAVRREGQRHALREPWRQGQVAVGLVAHGDRAGASHVRGQLGSAARRSSAARSGSGSRR